MTNTKFIKKWERNRKKQQWIEPLYVQKPVKAIADYSAIAFAYHKFMCLYLIEMPLC